MKKIYLASQSQARQKLLRNLGIPFRVVRVDAREKRHCTGESYARLVRENALRKARAAAARVRGVIVAADTVVVQGGRVFGKPRTRAQAFSMLKRFSGRAQDVYTGVAVIDTASAQESVHVERSRIHMDSLSQKEIERYFAHEDPRTMAGSFDVQGKGAFFVRRVEGCFYNVVGLPVRVLYRMLKSAGVVLLAALFVTGITGCTTEYNKVTGQTETFYYSEEQELKMGAAIARAVEKEYRLAEDPLIQERVRSIGARVAAVCDRKDISYRFAVIAEKDVNAVSLPGGYVYVFQGLIDRVASDDELAGVLAHEVGHIVARHSIKKLQAMQGYSLARLILAVSAQSGAVSTAADAAFGELLMGYSRDDELLADRLGARYSRLAGYDPQAMISFLKTLHDVNRKKPMQPVSYYRTHPFVPDRIRVTKQEIGESMDFTDYINMQERTDGVR
jgi:MAF protein